MISDTTTDPETHMLNRISIMATMGKETWNSNALMKSEKWDASHCVKPVVFANSNKRIAFPCLQLLIRRLACLTKKPLLEHIQ